MRPFRIFVHMSPDKGNPIGNRPFWHQAALALLALVLYGSTIGFGTEAGSEFPNCDQRLVGSEPSPGGSGGGPPPGGGRAPGGGGGGFRRGIDEATLKRVAALTDAEYYAPQSADELLEVFQSLPTSLIAKYEITEISFIFVTLGALLAVLAVLLALLWRPLP